MNSVANRVLRVALPLIVLAAVIGIWQLVTTLAPSFFFPTATRIGDAIADLYFSGPPEHFFLSDAFFSEVVPSLARLFSGWALGALVGIILGFVVGLLPRVAGYVDPVLQFLRSVPPPVIIPLYLILFGIGDEMKVLFIATGVLWPVLLNTIDGVRNVPTTQLDTAQAFKIRVPDRLLHVVLPAALPKIFAGLTIGVAVAIVVMVLSEMFAATNGIGYMLLQGQRGFRFPDMWGEVVLLGIIGFLFNTLLLFVEHRVLKWHRQSKGTI
ncbi:MAG TPA: ABC transporter permease [Microbacteriaceae bacterium]|nr:ABC transporter permease [Microbacteriaceae bacterium]